MHSDRQPPWAISATCCEVSNHDLQLKAKLFDCV